METKGRLPDQIGAELGQLGDYGLRAVLFGGWAKEYYGAWRGDHKDLDILVVAEDIDSLDAFMRDRHRQPFPAKRHAHKRAYVHSGLLVELFLVEDTPEGLVTNCYGRYRHHWLKPLGRRMESGRAEIVTPENILAYEENHHRVQQAFYEVFPELRREIESAYGDARFPYPHLFQWPRAADHDKTPP